MRNKKQILKHPTPNPSLLPNFLYLLLSSSTGRCKTEAVVSSPYVVCAPPSSSGGEFLTLLSCSSMLSFPQETVLQNPAWVVPMGCSSSWTAPVWEQSFRNRTSSPSFTDHDVSRVLLSHILNHLSSTRNISLKNFSRTVYFPAYSIPGSWWA